MKMAESPESKPINLNVYDSLAVILVTEIFYHWFMRKTILSLVHEALTVWRLVSESQNSRIWEGDSHFQNRVNCLGL